MPSLRVAVLLAALYAAHRLVPDMQELSGRLFGLAAGFALLSAATFLTAERHVPSRARLAAASLVHVCGFLVAALMLLHLSSVLHTALAGGRTLEEAWDFRLYSLVLMGVLSGAPAAAAAVHASGLARGHLRARGRAVRCSLLVLAINAPLMPLQDPAVGVVGLAALGLLAALLTHGRAQLV